MKDNFLFFIGYKLYNNDKFEEARQFLELYLNEFPEGRYISYGLNFLGNIYKDRGEKETALKYFKRYLELNPDDTETAAIIEELAEG